jgi:hypothetical protein
MVRVLFKSGLALASLPFFCCPSQVLPQNPVSASLNTSGSVVIDGHPAPYLIRRLPVSSFPDLPPAVKEQLDRRGCLIPQSYEARQPENVIHASLEDPGSSDWAVLCSAQGTVSLLVFFGSSSSRPFTLASAPETERLQSHGSSGVLGFNWAIDPASPQDVHEAQLGMRRPPPRLDHDALADSVIDRSTDYRFYLSNSWTLIETQD